MRRCACLVLLVATLARAQVPGPLGRPSGPGGSLPAPGGRPGGPLPQSDGRPGAAAETWPPTPSSGDYYGNSLPGWFGGKLYGDAGLPPTAGDEPQSMFQSGRGRQKLTFSGFADLGLTLRSVSGASETFSQDQYGKDQTLSQNASLLVTGTLWKWANLNINAQVEQRSWGFNDTKPVWRVFWEDQHSRVTFGDISPQIGDTNEFVPFSRRLKGLEAVGEIGSRFEYLAFGSQVGGSIRNQTFVGDGTAGPYYLTYVPIIDGSAVVVVDGVIQQAGYGETGDYTLNPSTGELLFNGIRIIPPTSTIEVRYETTGASGPKDLLLGAQLRYRPMPKLRFGIQYLTQIAGSSGDITGPTETRVTDTITVPTPSSGPFTIRPRPIVPGSETVQVNGLLQTRDVDYEIAYETGELQFFQILAEGATILVRFSVIEAVDLGSGDRSIFGFDTSWTPTEWLNVSLEFAQSRGDAGTTSNPFSFSGTSSYSGYGGSTIYSTYDSGGFGGSTSGGGTWGSGSYGSGSYGSGSYGSGGFGTSPYGGGLGASWRGRDRRTRGRDSVAAGWSALSRQTTGTQFARGGGGTAYRLRLTSRTGDFYVTGQLKSISDNFSRIDSTGFFQNEQGLSLQAQYSPGPRFSLSHQMEHFTRPYVTTTADEEVVSRVNSDLNLTSLQWRFLPNSTLTFTRNVQSNNGGGSGNSLSREAVTLVHNFSQQIQFNAGFDHATSSQTGTATTTTTTATSDSTTTAGRAGIGYNSSGGRLGARLDYSFSGTNSSVSRNSATSIMGSFNWQPFSFLTMQLSHQLSDSRNESLTGRTFDRVPLPGTLDYLLYRMELDRVRRQSGIGAFDPSGDGSVPTDPLTGGVIGTTSLTNNKTQNTSLSLLLTPIDRLSVNTSFGHSVTDNGRLAGSTNDNFQTNVQYQINDRMGFGLGYSLQALKYSDTGDQTTTGIFNANFDWRLSQRFDLRFDYQGMGTKNTAGPGTGEEPATSVLDPHTTYTSFGADARWQLPGKSGHSLFWQVRNDANKGGTTSNFSRFQFSTGIDFRLTSVIGLQLSYDLTDYQSTTEQTDNSYLAHLFNAGVGARF